MGTHLAGGACPVGPPWQLDWSIAFLDGSFAPAKKGGDQVGVTKKGKGTKWMLVIDGNGLPLGFSLASAQAAEVKLAEQTLDTIKVARPHGRPKCRPDKLVMDQGYDSRDLRRHLRQRGIRMCIPPRRRPATWRAKCGRLIVADTWRSKSPLKVTGMIPPEPPRLLFRALGHFAGLWVLNPVYPTS